MTYPHVLSDSVAQKLCQGVVGNQKVQVLPKPDNGLLPTGNALEANQWAETCARVVNRKDGRVYVAQSKQTG